MFYLDIDMMNPQAYQAQLSAKIDRIQSQFAQFNPPTLEIYESLVSHFRQRAEFRIWHTEDDLFYAMFERNDSGNKRVARVDEFSIASRAINELMPILLNHLKADPLLSERLFEVHF